MRHYLNDKLRAHLFDFENNDYEVRENGTDFWGNKRYEIIEKPKGIGCLGIIIVIVILVAIFSENDSETAQENADTAPTPEYIPEKSDEESTVNESEAFDPFEIDEYEQEEPDYYVDNTYESDYFVSEDLTPQNEEVSYVKDDQRIEIEDTELSTEEILNNKIKWMMDSLVSYTSLNKRKRIKYISEQLDISKKRVKQGL